MLVLKGDCASACNNSTLHHNGPVSLENSHGVAAAALPYKGTEFAAQRDPATEWLSHAHISRGFAACVIRGKVPPCLFSEAVPDGSGYGLPHRQACQFNDLIRHSHLLATLEALRSALVRSRASYGQASGDIPVVELRAIPPRVFFVAPPFLCVIFATIRDARSGGGI